MKPFQMKTLLTVITGFAFMLFAVGSSDSKSDSKNNSNATENNNINNTPVTPAKKCVGDQNCIANVRSNFSSTGKQILSEQYLGEGTFGISFLDLSRGEAYNAEVYTDCNCQVKDVNVSMIR
jgi:hypothetical protein